jgi:hypothetical protein
MAELSNSRAALDGGRRRRGGVSGDADERRLEELLPLQCRAQELRFMTQGPSGWKIRACYAFGVPTTGHDEAT